MVISGRSLTFHKPQAKQYVVRPKFPSKSLRGIEIDNPFAPPKSDVGYRESFALLDATSLVFRRLIRNHPTANMMRLFRSDQVQQDHDEYSRIPIDAKNELVSLARTTGLEHTLYLRKDRSWYVDSGSRSNTSFEPLDEYDRLERDFFGIPAAHIHPPGRSPYPTIQDFFKIASVARKSKTTQYHVVYGFKGQQHVETEIVVTPLPNGDVQFAMAYKGWNKREIKTIVTTASVTKEWIRRKSDLELLRYDDTVKQVASVASNADSVITDIVRQGVLDDIAVLSTLHDRSVDELRLIHRLLSEVKSLCLAYPHLVNNLIGIILSPNLSGKSKSRIVRELSKETIYYSPDLDGLLNVELLNVLSRVVDGMDVGVFHEGDIEYVLNRHNSRAIEIDYIRHDVPEIHRLYEDVCNDRFESDLIAFAKQVLTNKKITYYTKLYILRKVQALSKELLGDFIAFIEFIIDHPLLHAEDCFIYVYRSEPHNPGWYDYHQQDIKRLEKFREYFADNLQNCGLKRKINAILYAAELSLDARLRICRALTGTFEVSEIPDGFTVDSRLVEFFVNTIETGNFGYKEIVHLAREVYRANASISKLKEKRRFFGMFVHEEPDGVITKYRQYRMQEEFYLRDGSTMPGVRNLEGRHVRTLFLLEYAFGSVDDLMLTQLLKENLQSLRHIGKSSEETYLTFKKFLDVTARYIERRGYTKVSQVRRDQKLRKLFDYEETSQEGYVPCPLRRSSHSTQPEQAHRVFHAIRQFLKESA